MHSSGTEPYDDKGGSRPPPRLMMVTPRSMMVNAAFSPQCSPHPEKSDVMMCLMIFVNPALLGLLNGVVDLFIDATFSCVSTPFYQCLIIMVFDPSTSHVLPVIYALMMHKVQELYWQRFNQLFFLTKWKLQLLQAILNWL